MQIVNTVIPVFLVIALGFWLIKAKFIAKPVIDGLNRLVYYVGLPCLLFYKIANASYDYSAAVKTFSVVAGGMVVCVAVGYIVAFLIKIKPANIGTFVQGGYRGNLVYIGLPLVLYSFTVSKHNDIARIETIVVLVISLIVPVYNITAAVVLLASQHRIDRHVFGRIGEQLIRNPLVIACVSGIIYSAFFSRLPMALDRSLAAIGQMALPLALICIGGALSAEKIAGRVGAAFVSSLIKVAVAPIAGYFLAKMLMLGPAETRIAIIFLCCPVAISSYVMVNQIGGDGTLSATIVVISTLLSVISLSAAVTLF